MSDYPAYVMKELAFDAVIQKDNTGMKVRRVQEWLSIHGCPTVVDGDFGSATEKCTKDFQQMKDMPPTGRVDKETWNALIAPLIAALNPIQFSAETSIANAMLQVAQQHLAQHPIEVGGENRGPWVRVYMGGNHGDEWRWCAGFVTFIMKQACMLLNQSMPIPGSYSCDSLAYQAKEAGLFVKGGELESGGVSWPQLGTAHLFLKRKTSTDWTHAGLSFAGSGSIFSTIEGNTNDDGSSDGYEVCARTRSVQKKDFIRFPT
jgi:putative peptidoglycan binding protein